MRVRPNEEQLCVVETMRFLHKCWELTEHERPLSPDPFYIRNSLLTPVIVKKVIDSLEDIFAKEIVNYPGYHRNAQGVSESQYLVPPGFNWLPQAQQLAIVQGIDRIFQKHRVTDEEIAKEVAEHERRVAEQSYYYDDGE